jgi:hypothetical protein
MKIEKRKKRKKQMRKQKKKKKKKKSLSALRKSANEKQMGDQIERLNSAIGASLELIRYLTKKSKKKKKS